VLVVVGLLFCAGVYPMTTFFSREPAMPMIMSIYVTLGIFLLLAVRDPAANRSLIAFGGWTTRSRQQSNRRRGQTVIRKMRQAASATSRSLSPNGIR
jgi:uncharacterized protein DUF6632